MIAVVLVLKSSLGLLKGTPGLLAVKECKVGICKGLVVITSWRCFLGTVLAAVRAGRHLKDLLQ